MLTTSPKRGARKRVSNEPQGHREDTSVLEPTTPVRRSTTSAQRTTTDRPELWKDVSSTYWGPPRQQAAAPSMESVQTQYPVESLFSDGEVAYGSDAVADAYQSLAQALTSHEVLQALNMVSSALASASEQDTPLPEIPKSLSSAVTQIANICSPWTSIYRTLGAQHQMMNNGFETVVKLTREARKEATSQARKNEERLDRLERALDDIKNKPLPPTPQPQSHAASTPPPPTTQSKTRKAATTPKAPSNNTLEADHPSRLALEIRPGGLPKEKRMDELALRDRINSVLRDIVDPAKVQVAGTKWNPQGNCIVVTRQDQLASDLIEHVPKFAELVGQGMEVIPRLTAKWRRLMIHDVRTGLFDEFMPGLHTPDQIKSELLSNPVFSTLKSLAEEPRWLRRPQDIVTPRSTIIFAVTSEEEYKKLLKAKILWVYGRDCHDVEITLRSDIVTHRDIMILDVTQGDDTTTIVHIYNDRRLPAAQQASHLIADLTLPTHHPVLILGDFNLDHPLWSTEPSRTSAGADELVDWMSDNGYALLNKKGCPTHFPRRTAAAPSVLDLTFANGPAQQLDAAKGWALAPQYQYSSDHIGITFSLDYGVTPIENLTGERYNVKEVKPKEFRAALQEEIHQRQGAFEKMMDLGQEVSTDDLEDATTAITDAIQATLRRVAKI
ncbi:uncharacterized protein SCHCODRAFT_01048102, partial [Schizophyllum commune H4-8]|uniref:uncharacterized protein n=1 Tax=Schizophyllum commune (strain H4-8 / FGSC 9210) TaxID=578458 RepID=UPI00216108B7